MQYQKASAPTTNIAISKDVHELLVSFIQKIDGKIGKFTERAIKEKIEREAKKHTQ